MTEHASLTEAQAIALAKTEWWKDRTNKDLAQFQLFEPRLCMPFSRFHEAVEKTLGRPVFTHEFAFMEQLQKEFLGEKPAPSFQEILELIPADKRIVVIKTKAK